MQYQHDGLLTGELLLLGYLLQADGRMCLRGSLKSQCKVCGRWFARTKGEFCRTCFKKRRKEQVWAEVRE